MAADMQKKPMPALKIAVCITAFSFTLHMIAFSTNYWYVKADEHDGLWTKYFSGTSRYRGQQYLSGADQATQALLCVGLALYVTGFLLLILFLKTNLSRISVIPISAAVLILAAFLFQMIALTIWGSHYRPSYKAWSYVICMMAQLIQIVGIAFIFLEGKNDNLSKSLLRRNNKRNLKHRPVVPEREDKSLVPAGGQLKHEQMYSSSGLPSHSTRPCPVARSSSRDHLDGYSQRPPIEAQNYPGYPERAASRDLIPREMQYSSVGRDLPYSRVEKEYPRTQPRESRNFNWEQKPNIPYETDPRSGNASWDSRSKHFEGRSHNI